MNPMEDSSQGKHGSLAAKARLWRNIFAAATAGMSAQLVFNLERPGVLIASGFIILLLLLGLVLAQRRLRRVLSTSGGS